MLSLVLQRRLHFSRHLSVRLDNLFVISNLKGRLSRPFFKGGVFNVRRNIYVNFLVSLLLCVVMVFNNSCFNNKVYADPVTATAIAVELTPEAAAAIAAILAALGFEVATPDEVKEVVHAWIANAIKDAVTPKDFDEVFSQYAAMFLPVGVSITWTYAQGKYYISGVLNDVYKASINETIRGETLEDGSEVYFPTPNRAVILGNNGDYTVIDRSPNPQLPNDPKTPFWKRVVAGVMASSFGITTIGNSFYDFLHNSDNVEYIPPSPSAQVGNLEELNEYFKTLLVSNAFFSDVRFKKDDFLTNPPAFIKGNIEFFNIYMSVYSPKFDNDIDFSTSGASQRKYIAVIAKCDDGAYYTLNCSITDYANYGVSYSEIDRTNKTGNIGSSAYDYYIANVMNSSENWSYKAAYRGEGSEFGDGFLTHYAVSNVEDPDPLPDENSNAQVKIGDNIYNIKQGDNIYNNQQYVTQLLDGKTDSNGDTFVPLPAVDTATNTYTYPKPITITDDGSLTYGSSDMTFVNPDTLDYEEDTKLSDKDYEDKNIFSLLYNFFNNFWTKLRQVIKSIFITDEGLNFDGLRADGDKLKRVFPFCIPWDLTAAVRLLSAEPKPPVWQFSLWADGTNMFGLPVTKEDMTITIDLTEYEYLFNLLRKFEILCFCMALIMISRHIIGES